MTNNKKIKIQAVKFEVVDGKKKGKLFAFEMDPKEMAKYKTEATVRKKIEEYVAQSGYNLHRFIDAHDFAYAQALRELKEGRKRSHWIWYIFPQQKGLGHSHNSQYYGLDGEAEARAYIAHPVLGERLRECCRALLLHKGKDICDIMGSDVDVLKLNTSMNLFNRVSPNDVFAEVIAAFF